MKGKVEEKKVELEQEKKESREKVHKKCDEEKL